MGAERNRVIIRTSIIGILTNIFLAAFKAAVGFFSNSIAVVLDAVNNLSDALSSVITIIGTRLAGKTPDKEHPLGHGRIEYISAMVVAAIVLYAGVASAVESVEKIIHPEKAEYEIISLVIIAVAVVVKIVLGRYVKMQGERTNSGALSASGADAMFDAVLSFSVLISALISKLFGISLEAYVGLVISGFIVKAGVEMLLETKDDIVGRRADGELSKEIKRIIAEEPEVRGVYDLFINNYGPNKNYASAHVELPDVMTVEKVDVLTRRVQKNVYEKTGVVMTGLGVYSYNTRDDEAAHIRNDIQKLVMDYDFVLQMHGFYADTEEKTIRFDVVLSFDIEPKKALEIIYGALSPLYPDYTLIIAPDVDVTD